MKSCHLCKKTKDESNFNIDMAKSDMLSSRCKPCHKKYAKDWKIKNKERVQKTGANYYKINRERIRKNAKNHYEKHKDSISLKNKERYNKDYRSFKHQDLKKLYKMTIDQYEQLLEQQNHSCAICKTHKDNFTRDLSVDHCHITNKIRGLLCTNCNRAVGNVKDSVKIAKNLIKYLEESV